MVSDYMYLAFPLVTTSFCTYCLAGVVFTLYAHFFFVVEVQFKVLFPSLRTQKYCVLCCWYRFEGISWNSDETLIAYVAEEPSPSKPTFNGLGYKKGSSTDKDCGSWKGQGEWEEDWGETYAGKRQPALYVININRSYTSALCCCCGYHDKVTDGFSLNVKTLFQIFPCCTVER